MINRRKFGAATCAAIASAGLVRAAEPKKLKPKYILGSCMYGYTSLADILPEVAKTGATAIDIWPKPHGDQREQLDAMGEDKFLELLKQHNVRLGCNTQYKLGPFGLKEEMQLSKRLGCMTIVTGGKGPKGLKGQELKKAVQAFVEKMKPHIDVAEENSVTIAIENHANNLIESPDSMKWQAELSPSPHLAIAFAPYHLPQDEKLLAGLIRNLDHHIEVFYAWQHGNGCMNAQAKELELLQMPGRGKLDFKPLMQALSDIRYRGWMEIFMHPFPRGIAILDSTSDVTKEINRARSYLGECMS